jgi:hypothetical protein
MVREGKASLEADLGPIFERLKLDRVVLESTVAKLFQPAHRVPNQLGKSARSVGAAFREIANASPDGLDASILSVPTLTPTQTTSSGAIKKRLSAHPGSCRVAAPDWLPRTTSSRLNPTAPLGSAAKAWRSWMK